MDMDCIFNVILYCNKNNLVNCLLLSKLMIVLNTQYLYKLLCKRDYTNKYHKYIDKSWKEKYSLLSIFDNICKFPYARNILYITGPKIQPSFCY